MSDQRYGWVGWEAETDNDNDDDREGVYYLTITEDGEEYAVIVHRTLDGRYPLDGEVARQKVEQAEHIVAALNSYQGDAVPTESAASPARGTG